jgi:phage baseplate assembly protein gpV
MAPGHRVSSPEQRSHMLNIKQMLAEKNRKYHIPTISEQIKQQRMA